MARYIGAKSEILALHRHCCSCCTGHCPSGSSCSTKTNRNCDCISQRRQQVCQWLISTHSIYRILLICFFFSTFSRAVSSIYSTVFFPIFPWIFQIAVTIFALAVGLYLASIGQPVNQVLRLNNDTNCECTGAAQHYKVSMVWIDKRCKVSKAYRQQYNWTGVHWSFVKASLLPVNGIRLFS